MLMLSWRLTLLALLLLPVVFRITQRTSHGLRATSRQVYEKNAEVSRQVQEALAGVRTVKTFAGEEREARKVEGSLRQFLRSGITQSVIGSLAGELMTVSSAIAGFLVLGVSALEIIAGRFTLGDYLAFSAYMLKLHAPVQLLATLGLTLQPGMVALRRVLELFDRIAEEDRPGSLEVERLRGEIAFEQVEFNYEGQADVLRGASFRAGAGERVAIIGPSGAGKTTIAQLLLGLYRPRRGAILFDGRDIRRLSLNRLRERIGVVSQDVFLFNDTVRNNIRYSREGASDEEVARAAELADAQAFIAELPAGYETVVGEQGVALSGGQRQRLSIARAILKDPDVILLDEATSQLDPGSEERICRALLRSFAGKTLIVIGHRRSTAFELGVERVYELADGRLEVVPVADPAALAAVSLSPPVGRRSPASDAARPAGRGRRSPAGRGSRPAPRAPGRGPIAR
jgi:subfamily B ATP-binding cassette protein MsbA